MNVFCEALVALSINVGFCAADIDTKLTLPSEDQKVWEHIESEPKPELAKTSPQFPTVIIKHEYPPEAKQVKIETPTIGYTPETEEKLPEVIKINPYEIWAKEIQHSRHNLPVYKNNYIKSNILNDNLKLTALNMDANFDINSNKFQKPDEAEKYQTEGRYSTKPVDNSRIIGEDRFITGILETGINSQLNSAEGGNIIIQTARNIFGYHGRNVLIPKGSRLICQYKSPKDIGNSRLAIKCNRILIAGHRAEIIKLNSPIGDMQGRAGISGEVYNRYGEKYGMAFLMAAISATIRGASAGAASGKDDKSDLKAILNEGSEELSEKLGEITASILEQTVNLAPIITVSQGTRIQIRLAHDWYISPFNKEN